MPVVSEQDVEQLEAYVDGELTTTEEDALRARMSGEPMLAEAMKRVRADRDIRMAVWKSFEPSEASVQRLIARVDVAVEQQTNWSYKLSNFRRYAAAAACIVLGVLIGRAGNQGAVLPSGPYATVGQPQGVAGGPTMVSNPIEFPIVNEQGQPVGVQQFQSFQEARQFLDEINRMHRLREQIRSGNGQIVIPSERF